MSMILPKRYRTLNCIENCIANVCDKYAVDFSPLFLFSWDFGYDTSRTTIGERIHYHNDYNWGLDNYTKISEEYLNLIFTEKSINSNPFETYIRPNQIYMISIDSYDCNWNLAYRKYHYPHYFLLEKSERGAVAVDSFSTLDVQLPNSETINSIKGFYCISPTPTDNKKQIVDLQNIYYNTINANLNKNIFGDIQKFANDLSTIKNITALSPQISDVSNAYIVRRLSYIANSRYNTSLLFRYLNFDLNFIKGMKNIFILWESIKGLFIKALISRNMKNIDTARDLIVQVANEEMWLASHLLNG